MSDRQWNPFETEAEREQHARRHQNLLDAIPPSLREELADSERKLRELCLAHGPALIRLHDLEKELAQAHARIAAMEDTNRIAALALSEKQAEVNNVLGALALLHTVVADANREHGMSWGPFFGRMMTALSTAQQHLAELDGRS